MTVTAEVRVKSPCWQRTACWVLEIWHMAWWTQVLRVFHGFPKFAVYYLYLHGFVQDAPLDSEAHKKAGLGTPGNRGMRRKLLPWALALALAGQICQQYAVVPFHAWASVFSTEQGKILADNMFRTCCMTCEQWQCLCLFDSFGLEGSELRMARRSRSRLQSEQRALVWRPDCATDQINPNHTNM